MKETKHYAILCSTEEQARECVNKILDIHKQNISSSVDGLIKRLYTELGYHYVCFGDDDKQISLHSEWHSKNFGYTIITYEEAQSLGLLEEKKVGKVYDTVKISRKLTNSEVELIKDGIDGEKPKEENKIEKLDVECRNISMIVGKVNEIIRYINSLQIK